MIFSADTVRALPLAVVTAGIALAVPVKAQSWTQQFGTSEDDQVRAILLDRVGAIVVAGSTVGKLGGQAFGGRDAFLARYDTLGSQQWIRQFGTSEAERAIALSMDGSTGTIVGGLTSGDLGGANAGESDAFLARYDDLGNQIWLKQFGTSGTDMIHSLMQDGAGGVKFVGTSYGSLGGPNIGGADVVYGRYDAGGNQLWIRQFGSPGEDEASGIVPDNSGGLFVSGITSGDIGGPNAGGLDCFVARFDDTGFLLWIRQFGTPEWDFIESTVVDGSGGVLVSGRTGGDLGGPSAGGDDAYIARFDRFGNQLWIHQFGTIFHDSVNSLAIDSPGFIFGVGETRGILGTSNAGQEDVFITRYDISGKQIWLEQFGSNSRDWGSAITPDGTGGFIAGGRTLGDIGGANSGLYDAFLRKFAHCYSDCTASTGLQKLDIFDFLCWQNLFVLGNVYACDCDTSTGIGVCDVFDFLCFQDAFVGGCP